MAHTYNTLKSLLVHYTKVNNPPDGFCTNILFVSAIILIFGCIFIHRLSKIFKVKLKCLKAPTVYYAKQKWGNRREN